MMRDRAVGNLGRAGNSVSKAAWLVLGCTLVVAACSSSRVSDAGTSPPGAATTAPGATAAGAVGAGAPGAGVSPATGPAPGVGQSGPSLSAGPQAVPAAPGTPGDLSAAELVSQLKDAGLPVTSTIVYTVATDSEHLLGAPGGYISKAAFVDSRIPSAGLPDTSPGSVWLGGSVEVFRTPAEAQRRQQFLTSQASDPAKAEYVYVRGPVLLRVSHTIDVTYADGYSKIFQRTG